MGAGLNLKLQCIVDMINREIDGECHGCLSRFNCEWYYHITIKFNYSDLHISLTISEETMKTQTVGDLIPLVINRIKADILSNYFK